MLRVSNIDVYYGKVQALFNVSFEATGDDIVSIIGANGAGKTTLMKTIMGVNSPARGTVEYDGKMHQQMAGASRLYAKRSCMCRRDARCFPRSRWRKTWKWAHFQ